MFMADPVGATILKTRYLFAKDRENHLKGLNTEKIKNALPEVFNSFDLNAGPKTVVL